MCITKPLAELERWLVITLNNGERLYSRVHKDEASDEDPLTNVYELAKERVLQEYGYTDEDIADSYVFHKREENCIYISGHAFERLKQRNGWNKKTALRMVKKVYDNGTSQEEMAGYIRKWLDYKDAIHKEENSYFKIYGKYVYVFNSSVLLTVLKIPTKAGIISRISGISKKAIAEDDY